MRRLKFNKKNVEIINALFQHLRNVLEKKSNANGYLFHCFQNRLNRKRLQNKTFIDFLFLTIKSLLSK